ncbi:alcohol dehydrogenase [Firmicutes bacterium AM43-11BH]|nr:alcohol dehydrogenase [Firmicutes bacterium AM43-11BH]
MRTIIISEPGKVAVTENEIPKVKEGEALLKLLYGGICGSDLGTYRGTFAYASYPRIPGHEFSAQIVEIGENDRGLKPGMIVTCNPYFNCQKCYSCERGLVNCCESNETMGAQRDGAFSEYITMPIERIYDGKGLNPKQLALIEPFCISYHGVSRADVKKGDKVLVIGAGTIGVLAAIAAKAKGGEVYIVDVAEEKLQYAYETFGLAGMIKNESEEAFMNRVNEITGEHHGFDVCIEAVGLPATFQNCIDAAAYGGRIVLIGVGKKNLDFNFTLIQKKELNIFGSRNALKADFTELIDLVKSGEIDLEKIVMNPDSTDVKKKSEYELDEADRAFEEFSKYGGSKLKVLIHFSDPS